MSVLIGIRARLRVQTVLVASKVFKSKLARRKVPSEFALDHFDSFYSKVFGVNEWRSARLALLSYKKYCAVINPFAMTEELFERLHKLRAEELNFFNQTTTEEDKPTVEAIPAPEMVEMKEKDPEPTFDDSARLIKKGNTDAMLNYVPASEMIYQEEVLHEEDYFEFMKPETEILKKTHKPLPMPQLRVFTFPPGVISDFPSPRKPIDNLFEYYLMDCASLLPVIALDVKPGEDFADFCAAPGGKSLAVAFLQNAATHLCVDRSPARISRMKGIFGTYLPKKERSKIEIKHTDILEWRFDETFDKILVDAPCTNDRLSLEKEDGNIFHPIRTNERLKLPEYQKSILTKALQHLRKGGAAVYSTCSLSPIQNDAVVHMAIQGFKEKKFIVTNLEDTFVPFHGVFNFSPNTRYGQLVMPYLPNNFGPMYICRIERVV